VSAEPTFAEYLAGAGRDGGAFVTEPTGMRLYVYRRRYVPGGIGLGTIEVPAERQRQGILKAFLAEHADLPLRIENVVNTDLENWLLRQPDWAPEDPDWIHLGASYVNTAWQIADGWQKREAA